MYPEKPLLPSMWPGGPKSCCWAGHHRRCAPAPHASCKVEGSPGWAARAKTHSPEGASSQLWKARSHFPTAYMATRECLGWRKAATFGLGEVRKLRYLAAESGRRPPWSSSHWKPTWDWDAPPRGANEQISSKKSNKSKTMMQQVADADLQHVYP